MDGGLVSSASCTEHQEYTWQAGKGLELQNHRLDPRDHKKGEVKT